MPRLREREPPLVARLDERDEDIFERRRDRHDPLDRETGTGESGGDAGRREVGLVGDEMEPRPEERRFPHPGQAVAAANMRALLAGLDYPDKKAPPPDPLIRGGPEMLLGD